eukprot:CAMPEP_0176419156 /NCGR_PEP_ID=MMETSP0127-20121128/7884_1 /TAXON_ID=938130 /ORGANISM="Platyophrya macrostoma, Strain WH" /LENGTH=193 /DNA_ID=CAMNT_0017799589 /DNA_START=178 /DNA_END=759 /DNA_ORIENTATION=+
MNPMEMDPYMNASLQLYLQYADYQNYVSLNNDMNKFSQRNQVRDINCNNKRSQSAITADEKSNDCAKTETTSEDTKPEEAQQSKQSTNNKSKPATPERKEAEPEPINEPIDEPIDCDKLNPHDLEFELSNSFNSWDMLDDPIDDPVKGENFLEESQSAVVKKSGAKGDYKKAHKTGELGKPAGEQGKRKKVKK